MIIQFTIGNFLSFKEQSTLSLAASALKEIQVPAKDYIFSRNLYFFQSSISFERNTGSG